MEVKYLQAELLVFTLLPCFWPCVAYMSRKGKLGMANWAIYVEKRFLLLIMKYQIYICMCRLGLPSLRKIKGLLPTHDSFSCLLSNGKPDLSFLHFIKPTMCKQYKVKYVFFNSKYFEMLGLVIIKKLIYFYSMYSNTYFKLLTRN